MQIIAFIIAALNILSVDALKPNVPSGQKAIILNRLLGQQRRQRLNRAWLSRPKFTLRRYHSQSFLY